MLPGVFSGGSSSAQQHSPCFWLLCSLGRTKPPGEHTQPRSRFRHLRRFWHRFLLNSALLCSSDIFQGLCGEQDERSTAAGPGEVLPAGCRCAGKLMKSSCFQFQVYLSEDTFRTDQQLQSWLIISPLSHHHQPFYP